MVVMFVKVFWKSSHMYHLFFCNKKPHPFG